MAQTILDIDVSKSIETNLAELKIELRPVILLLGDFDSSLTVQVHSICDRVIAPLAADPGALLVDNGRRSGCAAVAGQVAAEQDKAPPHLGIVPFGTQSSDIDTNHRVLLRLPADWSDESKFMAQIVEHLARNETGSKPVVVVLFGSADKKLLVRCARRAWPLVIVTGTGGVTDQIYKAITPSADGTKAPAATDADLREIAETATIYSFALDGNSDDLSRLIRAQTDKHPETVQETLAEAWSRFAELDQAALTRQKEFRSLEFAIIGLGVVTSLLAVLSKSIPWPFSSAVDFMHTYVRPGGLGILLILAPIVMSIVTAYNSHFRDGNKWVLFRGAAETLKREIFRFQARAGGYSDEACVQISRESKLAAKVKEITASLEQSEANKTSLAPASKPNLLPEAFLSPDQYVGSRLHDQMDFLVKKTAKLSTQLRTLLTYTYLAGGTATFIAAVAPNYSVWVALPTAVAAALTTKLQAEQVENSLTQYNQTLASLRNIEIWWKALTPWEKSRQTNIDLLVDETEKTLEAETAGWVQKMQTTLDKLTEKESDPASDRG